MPATVPTSISDVTPEWLHQALAASFPTALFRSIESERIGEGYGLSSELWRLHLVGGESPVAVVVKLWDTSKIAGTREVLFFGTFAGGLGARTPRCHYASIDEQRNRGVLVLEDLGDVVQGDCLERLPKGAAIRLAEAVASVHATWWERRELEAAEWLPRAPIERDDAWLTERRALFLERFPNRLDPLSSELLRDIERTLRRSRERLANTATTLLHADLHLDNVVFDGETGEPILLDWARVAKGPIAIDLIELLVEIAKPPDVDAVLGAYLGAIRRRGIALDDADFERQLGGALLWKFSRWTCGVANWQPASEREARMIDTGFERAMRAVADWRAREPALFRWDGG